MTKKLIAKSVGKTYYSKLEPVLDTLEEIPRVPLKSPQVGLIFSILLGFTGLDRLYQGGIKMMLRKLFLLLMSMWAWYFPDIYYCREEIYKENYIRVKKALCL